MTADTLRRVLEDELRKHRLAWFRDRHGFPEAAYCTCKAYWDDSWAPGELERHQAHVAAAQAAAALAAEEGTSG